jgi:hypothetical protein
MLVLVVGGLMGCGSAGNSSLKVGDCVNFEPSDEGPRTIKVDCAQPHDQEVFLTFDLPSGPFPGYFEIGDAQQDECGPAFEEFVGVPWEQSVYTFDFAGPTEQTWATGDHTIVCSLEDASGGKLTGSARGTAQ